MSVFTPVSDGQLAGWLKGYSVGAPLALEPIAAGIENTNYFVTTSQGRYVLTLFERLPAAEVPFYLDLMAHLARHGIPCPAPIAGLDDRYLSSLNGKPAALVTRLEGASVDNPGAARMRRSGRRCSRACTWRRALSAVTWRTRADRSGGAARRPTCGRFSMPASAALLDEELRFQARHRFPDLPRAAVHADLFRDNAVFKDGRISGVFDFYFAGVDCFIFDLAVCANDWCLVHPERDRRLDGKRTQALLDAYEAVRPLRPGERAAWPVMLRAAALRFWLSRLHDKHLPRPGELVKVHDPEHFRAILELRAAPGAQAPWTG